MIDELLKAGRISPEEFDIYMLYQVNELGRKSLERMMFDTFMDEPQKKEFRGIGFAFYDGRRSVFRDIRRTILKVEFELQHLESNREVKDDNSR